MYKGDRSPNGDQYASKRRMKKYRGCLKAQIARGGVSRGESVPERGLTSKRRVVCGKGKQRVDANWKAPDIVRGLTKIQYTSRMNGEGCGGWLKARAGTRRTVELKRTPKESKNKSAEGLLGGRLRKRGGTYRRGE